METRNRLIAAAMAGALACACWPAQADEFSESDAERWYNEYLKVVDKGEQLFHGGLQSKNTVSCDQCHPNAANTHPETYPKFQQQLGKVAQLWEMVNWCIQNPLESEPLDADDPRMAALQAYILYERRGVALDPGRH